MQGNLLDHFTCCYCILFRAEPTAYYFCRKEMHLNRGPLSICALRVFQYFCPYWFTREFTGRAVLFVLLSTFATAIVIVVSYSQETTSAVHWGSFCYVSHSTPG